jgi:hypothetical protein
MIGYTPRKIDEASKIRQAMQIPLLKIHINDVDELALIFHLLILFVVTTKVDVLLAVAYRRNSPLI